MQDPKAQAASAVVAWSGTGISYWLESLGFHSYADAAAFLAAVYSVLLIIDWVRKRRKGGK